MSTDPTDVAASTPGRASVADTARIALNVVLPTLAVGVIARRPRVFGLADRLDADRRAIAELQRLADRYGTGPIGLAVPGRSLALVLDPTHVHDVLRRSPEPFALANREKRAALAHFQPHGVLISDEPERTERRRFNEAVLDTGNAVHRLAEPMVAVIRDEADRLIADPGAAGALTADRFVQAWWRMTRRITLGGGARDDDRITDLLGRLRREANWAFLAPRRPKVFREFRQRLDTHLRRAEPGSLAGLIADTPMTPATDPGDQVAHWLFAFDAAGLATIRALALLATHPTEAQQAKAEIDDLDLARPQRLPLLRASVLESARLWPTTPTVLRDTTTDTHWPSGRLPAGTGLLIFAPYFHRNDRALPYAHGFAPRIWLDDSARGEWPLIPFSEGPGVCPGQNLVLLTGSTFLATLLDKLDISLDDQDKLDPDRPLPATFSPYRLRFSVRPRH